MPFKSDKQRKLMYAVANNPAVAKKTGISKKVADKFIEHKAQGGSMATKMPKEGSAAYKAQERKHVNAMKKAGVDPKIVAEEKREAGLKKGGGVKRYQVGGMALGNLPMRARPAVAPAVAPAMAARATPAIVPRAGMNALARRAEGGPAEGYAFGGMTGPGGEMSPDDMAQFAESLKKEADTRRSKQGAGMGGSATVGFKKGGKIDGCAVRGKTKGRFI